jgi:hypothetical protein
MVDPDSGEVDRETVINVLRHHKVDVSPDPLVPSNMLIVRENVAISLPFDAWVKRRTTDLLKRRFGIPIHHFFKPEMMAFETLESSDKAN